MSRPAPPSGVVDELSYPRLVGGALCLDFANTIDPRHSDQYVEYLTSYEHLVEWAVHAGGISIEEATPLVARATTDPIAAANALKRARVLREAIYMVLTPDDVGNRGDSLDHVNRELAIAQAHAHITMGRQGYAWKWIREPLRLDQVLWPVVRSAADLMTSGGLHRVRECSGTRCGWLFIDRSIAGRRRWCDMRVCGNRAKARRHALAKRNRTLMPQ